MVRLGNPDDGAVLRFEPQLPPEPVRAPEPPQPSVAHLPSVDRRPTNRMPLPAKVMRIGRTPENDLVVSDLGVSRKHAELQRYWTPEEFAGLEQIARAKGFLMVSASPLTRSSYHADSDFAALKAARAAQLAARA